MAHIRFDVWFYFSLSLSLSLTHTHTLTSSCSQVSMCVVWNVLYLVYSNYIISSCLCYSELVNYCVFNIIVYLSIYRQMHKWRHIIYIYDVYIYDYNIWCLNFTLFIFKWKQFIYSCLLSSSVITYYVYLSLSDLFK